MLKNNILLHWCTTTSKVIFFFCQVGKHVYIIICTCVCNAFIFVWRWCTSIVMFFCIKIMSICTCVSNSFIFVWNGRSHQTPLFFDSFPRFSFRVCFNILEHKKRFLPKVFGKVWGFYVFICYTLAYVGVFGWIISAVIEKCGVETGDIDEDEDEDEDEELLSLGSSQFH